MVVVEPVVTLPMIPVQEYPWRRQIHPQLNLALNPLLGEAIYPYLKIFLGHGHGHGHWANLGPLISHTDAT